MADLPPPPRPPNLNITPPNLNQGNYSVFGSRGRVKNNLDDWSMAFKNSKVTGPLNIVSEGQPPIKTDFFTGRYGIAVPPPPTPKKYTHFDNATPM